MLTEAQLAAIMGLADTYAEAQAAARERNVAARVLPYDAHLTAEAERAQAAVGKCRRSMLTYLDALTEPVNV